MPNTMYPAKINSPKTELAAAIAADATTITVVDVTKLPAAPNLCTILNGDDSETFSYASISGSTLSGCIRGLNGTAKAWAPGMKVARTYTAYDHDTFIDQINEIVSKLVAATTVKAGLVQLSDATTSTATDRAATANAVKKAIDAAAQDATTKANAAKTDAQSYTTNTAFVKRGAIASGTDLNTVINNGEYSYTEFSNYTNIPANVSYGILNVYTESNYIVQEINQVVAPYSSYKRVRTENVWSPWEQRITSKQVIPGTGNPEGVVSAPPGTMFLNSNGGSNTTLYVKQSGTGSSGWVAK